jgi:hypothetical protein
VPVREGAIEGGRDVGGFDHLLRGAIMLGRSCLAIQIEVRDSGKIEWICQVNNRHFDVPFDLPTRRGFREDIALQYFAA